jgi:ubiquinol-cytochrome c reductase cytochrome b subunit
MSSPHRIDAGAVHNVNVRPEWQAWVGTTGAIVLMLLLVQFLTGLLLAFYYVPSVDHAYTTVSYIEKVVSSGSWIRSLHHYGSQWLALFAFLHVLRLWWNEAYVFSRAHWVAAVLLLALVMAGAGTGYSLPWDARAFFSTRVAEGLMGGLPLAGRLARLWLLGGSEISTITLSRFFALHVLVTPFLILAVIACRLLRRGACWPNLRRNVFVAGLVFLVLALWTLKFRAPLGPSAATAGADYLPRPGSQFLWLYQTLKHVPGGLGSVAGVVLPSVGLALLLLLPWLGPMKRFASDSRRVLGGVVLGVLTVLVLAMTVAANLSDRRDPRTREQLAKQAAQEAAWRNEPFSPVLIGPPAGAAQTADSGGAPIMYVKFCANCHGPHGEGAQQGRLKFPPLLDVSAKPRRTVEDIAALLKDPEAYGLQPPMRSFASKLTEPEMREIAEWVVRLKK